MTRPPVKRTYGRSNKRPLPNDLPSSPTRQHKRVNFNDSLPTSDDQENQQPDLDQPGKHDAVQAYRRGKCTPTNAEDKVFSEKNGRLRENADPVLKHIVSTNITNIPSSSKPPRRGQTTISDFFTSKPTAPTTHTPHRTFKPSPPTPPHRLLSPPPSSPSPSSPFPSVRARPRKLTIPHFTIDAPPAAMTPKPRRYEQLYLELGQRNCGATTCAECHMSYNRGQREDDILHEAYHRVAVGGIDYPSLHLTFLGSKLTMIGLQGRGRDRRGRRRSCRDAHASVWRAGKEKATRDPCDDTHRTRLRRPTRREAEAV
ncbi:hypothetical protein BC938DRAFT_476571 [Jimgerdemannia flammicorona]|uniref:N-acetyltransferase ESCO zinc-finger domain-containing protein n=1 Tax=Jimgerdemannia flammicorona TaxID=994334 RepID=A0A433PG20_9FUNG|nr:hypothetical protein BC938DRAFT_476571 [Jimgerdemannia flammicorona]